MSEDQPEKVGVARPTAKRQLAGVSTASASPAPAKAKHAVSDEPEKEGNKILHAITSFIPQVIEEMKKVIWPTPRQMVTYTVMVFAFLIIVTALVSGVDFLAGFGVEKILTQ